MYKWSPYSIPIVFICHYYVHVKVIHKLLIFFGFFCIIRNVIWLLNFVIDYTNPYEIIHAAFGVVGHLNS